MPSRKPTERRTTRSEGNAKPERINLKALAEHLKLSRTTVSLVLNNAPHAQRIAPETRERVRVAAEALGYKPNYFARSLTGKRSMMVGVIAPDFGEGYDAVVLSGIEGTLLQRGFMYFVSSHLWSEDVMLRAMEALEERGAEGVILLNTPMPRHSRLPAVSIGRAGGDDDLPRITIDNHAGMRLTFEYLVSLGHREIAILKGHEGSSDTEERWEGALQAAQSCGIRLRPELAVQLVRQSLEGSSGIDEGYLATRALLEQGLPFTALVCFNDMSACGAMNAIRESGRRIPQDVSVIGFDDIPIAKISNPTLTTVRQPLREMGTQAAKLLLRRIEDPTEKPPDVSMAPELIVRESTGTCPTRRRQAKAAPAASRKAPAARRRRD